MRHQRFTTSILLAGALGLGAGAPAWAEETDGSAAGNEATTGGEPVSDEQLQQFVVAMNEIREIRMEYAPKLQEAENEEEQNQLRQAGREEMLDAIRDSGLEAKEYNQIGQRINNDEELKQRARELAQEQGGN